MSQDITDNTSAAILHQLIGGHWIAQAIAVVAELGVADTLADGPMSTDSLARSTKTHVGALYRLLRALASVGIFTEVEPQRFGLTPIGSLLRQEIPGSLHALALITNQLDWAAWGAMLHSVRTGEPAFQHVHGIDPFTYFQSHPEIGTTFDEAMTGFVTQYGLAAAATYDFTPFSHIVDVGGGHGALMIAILQRSPAARGTIFDQASVIDGARRAIGQAGLAPRCQFVAGDFFDSIPAGADAYVLASIVHDWDDEHCQKILRSCHGAMGEYARLLLVEMVIPTGDEMFDGKWLDLEMLVCFGGRERTEDEYRALLADAEFRLTRIVPTNTAASVIEAVPVP